MDRREIFINALLMARVRNIALAILLLMSISISYWSVLTPYVQGEISKEKIILFSSIELLLFLVIYWIVLTTNYVMRVVSSSSIETCLRILCYRILVKEFEKNELVLSLKQNQEKFYVVRIEKDQAVLFEEIMPDKKTTDKVFEDLERFLS